MPVITAAIDPITRIEGHLKVEIDVDAVDGVQQVVEARATGTLFRGFEKLLEGRDPRDAILITSRICGVCPTSHSQTAALLLDRACGVAGDVPERTASRYLRNLTHGACFIESSLLHFYLLSLPDFVPGLPMAPWLPGWRLERRLDPDTQARFSRNYLQALTWRRHAHEMGAIYGGKLPHSPAFLAGGFTAVSSAADKAAFAAYLDGLLGFIEGTYLPDAELLASLFPEYLALGQGYGHLLAFGAFELDNQASPQLLLPAGRKVAGSAAVAPVDAASIAESVKCSWFADSDELKNPAQADTVAQYPKDGAYSWMKAPRYEGLPYETGPLARMTVSGDYSQGVSVMDRHVARARETLKIAQAMRAWIQALEAGRSAYVNCDVPDAAQAFALTEAPRGALGHWCRIADRRISAYQVVTPTCWNVSPKDGAGQRGPLEQALIGVPVANVSQPIEVLRVVHSYDPCLDCATHVARVDRGARVFALGSFATPPALCP